MNNKTITTLIALAIPVLALTFLTFLVLRLAGVVDWSYLWVFSPLWGPIALYILFLAAVVLVALIASLTDIIRKK